MNRRCSQCGRINRIPPRHLADTGRCGACKTAMPPASHPLEVSSSEFGEIVAAAKVPVFVDFWASWCGPCRAAAPYVDALAAKMAGRAVVVKVDTEQEPELAARFDIRSIPTFAVFSRGNLVQRQAGFSSPAEFERLLSAAR